MACQFTGVSHTPAVERGQDQLHELDPVAHHHRDVVARSQTQLIEQGAQSRHPIVELRPPTCARQVIDGDRRRDRARASAGNVEGRAGIGAGRYCRPA